MNVRGGGRKGVFACVLSICRSMSTRKHVWGRVEVGQVSGLGGFNVVDGDNFWHLLRFPFQKRGPASSVLRAPG